MAQPKTKRWPNVHHMPAYARTEGRRERDRDERRAPGTSQAGRENVPVPGGLLDSSTGGVPSSRVPERLKWPFWEGADLILVGLDCCLPAPWRVPLRLIALLLLAYTAVTHMVATVSDVVVRLSLCSSVHGMSLPDD